MASTDASGLRPGKSACRALQPLIFLLVGVMTACGCSAELPPLYEVRGIVTFNGLPAHAEVTFEPVAKSSEPGGRPSVAWTRPDGTYRLQFTQDRYGAVEGDHRVTLRILRPPSDDRHRTFDDATSALKLLRLRRTVTPRTNEWHFATFW